MMFNVECDTQKKKTPGRAAQYLVKKQKTKYH